MTEYICLTLADADATPLHLPKGSFAFSPFTQGAVPVWAMLRGVDWNIAKSIVRFANSRLFVCETEAEIKALLGIVR